MADASDRAARRQANFAGAGKTSPLPPSLDDLPLPGGLELGEDEFVVRTAKDWGAPVMPPPPAGDRYERLRQIGELRASGVLSEAEFEEEKARILSER